MKRLVSLALVVVGLLGCGLEPASDTSDSRLESISDEVLDEEATGRGAVAGTYAVTLESTLQIAATGSPVDRLVDAATLRCFFSTTCNDAIDRIAKVESAQELLGPHCDQWHAEHDGNVTTVVCQQIDRRAVVVDDGTNAFIELETEDGDVTTTSAPLPQGEAPLVIDDLVDELGGALALYFTPLGFVGAREATHDSTLVADVLDALDDADLQVEVVLDFAIRGRREGVAAPDVFHLLEYF
jgi:hypothetical protein